MLPAWIMEFPFTDHALFTHDNIAEPLVLPFFVIYKLPPLLPKNQELAEVPESRLASVPNNNKSDHPPAGAILIPSL
jgi:hypothetical protein